MKVFEKLTKDYITDLDMFGYPITLNFNKNGNEYKTIIGGTMSLLIKLTIFLYFGLNLYGLLTLGNNENNMQMTLTDYDQGQEIKYSEMDFVTFYPIRKQLMFGEKVEMNEESARYVEYFYV